MTTTAPPLECTVDIDAPPATVWTFWTDPARLCEWWGIEADAVAQPGGVFRVVMANHEAVMRGEYVELDPPHRLVFTFGWEEAMPSGPVPPGSTRVEVTLEPVGTGTRLVLRHHDLPEAAVPDHSKGWMHFIGERMVLLATEMASDPDATSRNPV